MTRGTTMTHRAVAITLLAALLATAPAAAGIDKAGTTAANFLTVGQGASVLGMGGATLGYGSDLNTAAWNSAALTRLNATQIVFSHASLDQENSQEWAAIGGRWGKTRRFWSATGLYQGNGSFDGRDAFGNPTGSFSASSMALGLNLAQTFASNVSVGMGAQYVSENLGDVTGSGFTFNAGVQMQRGIWGIGAAAQNVFGQMKYDGAPYPFPGNYGVGVSVMDPTRGLRFALDLNFPDAYYSDVRTGVEWRYKDHIALRTGYRKELGADSGEPLGGPTFGMGAGSNGFWFDYGLVTGGGGASAEHRIGLTYRPGFNNTVPGIQAGATSTAAEPPVATKATEPKTTTTKTAKPAKSKPVTPTATPTAASTAAVTGGALAAEPDLDSAPPRASATKSATPATDTKKAPAAGAETKPGVQYVPPVAAGIPVASAAGKPASAASATGKATPTPTTTAPATQSNEKPGTTPSNAKEPGIAAAAGVSSVAGAKEPVVKPDTKAAAAPATVTPSSTAPEAAKASAAPQGTKTTAKSDDSSMLDDLVALSAPAAAETAKPSAAASAASATTTVRANDPPRATAPPTESVKSESGKSESGKSEPVKSEPVTSEPTKSEPAKVEPAKAAPVVAPAATPEPAKAEPAKPAGKRPAKVKVGKNETLADVAAKWNTTAAAIMMENNMVTDKVKPGQELKLPPARK